MLPTRSSRHSFLILALCLCGSLLVLFYESWLPGMVLFSNDGPLGAMNQAAVRLPGAFTGVWYDLNTLGSSGGSSLPDISQGLFWLLGPVGYSKFYAPTALLILGIGAWCFFRQLGLSSLACVLGGIAAMLNSGFFSVACWGVAAHSLTFGMGFLALAALADTTSPGRWLRVALAGMAVGMGVCETPDIGAIVSLYVAAFVAYQALTEEGGRAGNVVLGVVRLGLVAGCAAFIAAQAVSVQVATAITGVAGTQQDTQTKAQRWDFATQWSLPKVETLQFVVPGLFGYRMDTPDGGNYWGAVGRDPFYDRFFASGGQGEPPDGEGRFMRQTGGGIYAGVLVLLLGVWGATQSFRGKESVFSLAQRKWLWFWLAVAGGSLLLAWGRFAPFYQILYALPYASTIRSPAKFAHLVNFALVVLFAYGVHGLSQRYLQVALTTSLGPVAAVLAWWKRVRGFDRQWAVGGVVALGVSALAWLWFASGRKGLVDYLNQVQLGGELAEQIASFSVRQAGIFLLLLAVALGLVLLVLSGWCAGRRSRWGAVLLGGFLLLDLGRANLPWIIPVDWSRKYATNPVIEFLRQRPYEQRVVGLPFRMPQQLGLLGDVYRIEWAQHHFPFFNIQSLDIVQMPRMPEDLAAFESAWRTNGNAGLLRRWELGNARYVLGPAEFAAGMNAQVDAEKKRFSVKFPFDFAPKPDVTRVTRYEDLTAVAKPEGPYAVLEFSGALPRAKLYSQWSVNTNDAAVLRRLFDPAFDPQTEVIVNSAIPAPAAANTNAAGTVEFTAYSPRHIVLKAEVKTPAVLLLNDRYEGNWQVRVDGQPAPLLRANYLMRAVRLEPGSHTVEFSYGVPMRMFYVSLAALGVAFALGALILLTGNPRQPPPAPAPEKSK